MAPTTIVLIIVGIMQALIAVWLRRHEQCLLKLARGAMPDIDRRAMAGDTGRLLPEARQLLHDLDEDAKAAKPVIDNLVQITFALRTVCERVEKLLARAEAHPPVAIGV